MFIQQQAENAPIRNVIMGQGNNMAQSQVGEKEFQCTLQEVILAWEITSQGGDG